MALTKVHYTDNETVIGAKNLNDIQDEIIANGNNIATLSTNKVDKVTGKGLSTLDFTVADRQAISSAYVKPGAGVPKTDLSQDVQTSLDKADNALQAALDETLTVSGAAADARVTGETIGDLKSALNYYTAINKKNLLTPVTFVKNYVVVGGAIQPSDTYGYVEIDVTNGTKYISNTAIRLISGQDKERIITDVTEWTATYTGKAYFNYELSRVISSSVLYAYGADVDTIGSYGSRALDDDVLKQNLGNSKIATMSQNAIMDVVSNKPTITYTSGYYMDVNKGRIYTSNAHSVSNVLFLKKGQRIVFKANGYGNGVVSVFGETDSTGETLINSIVTSNGNNYQDVDYTATHDMWARISILSTSTVPSVMVLSNGVAYAPSVTENTITVGTGKDYTSLVDAINSITDSNELNHYTIYLYEGTYDTIETSKIDANYDGLIVPDYVSIIGVGNRENIVITAEIPSGYESYARYISTLNFRDNGRLENVTVEAKNLRYCNHDDHRTQNNLVINHQYINCVFHMKAVDSGIDVSGACVGIGAMYDKQILFDRCEFINDNSDTGNRVGILIHDSNGQRGCVLTVKSCGFTGTRWNMRVITNDGDFENIITLAGNHFRKPIYVNGGSGITKNAFSIRAWGNKSFSYVQDQALDDISADVDAYANET